MVFDFPFQKSLRFAYLAAFFFLTSLWQNVLTQELAHRFGSFLTEAAGNPFGMLGRAEEAAFKRGGGLDSSSGAPTVSDR